MIWALTAADLPGPLPLLIAAMGAPLVALTLCGRSRAGTALTLMFLMLAARQALSDQVAASLVISVLLFVLLLLTGQLAADTYPVRPTAVLAVCAASATAIAGLAVSHVTFHRSVLWWPTALWAMLVAYAMALPGIPQAARSRNDRTEV